MWLQPHNLRVLLILWWFNHKNCEHSQFVMVPPQFLCVWKDWEECARESQHKEAQVGCAKKRRRQHDGGGNESQGQGRVGEARWSAQRGTTTRGPQTTHEGATRDTRASHYNNTNQSRFICESACICLHMNMHLCPTESCIVCLYKTVIQT